MSSRRTKAERMDEIGRPVDAFRCAVSPSPLTTALKTVDDEMWEVGRSAHKLASLIVDISDVTVREYQDARLKEKAAPKTINEEVGFLLRLIEDRGVVIRAQLKLKKTLKLKGSRKVAKAFSTDEKGRLIEAARGAQYPTIYPALMLALNAGLRNGEIRSLTWSQINLDKRFLTVGKSKTEAGEGRTIPLNAGLYEALQIHREWYLLRFGATPSEWYFFPFGRGKKTDPTRPVTTIKTAWKNARQRASVNGRLHDSRHTLITELAESGAGDQTIMDIAGHVSRQMLKHYSHIRMEAKRTALQAVWEKHEEDRSSDPKPKSCTRGNWKDPQGEEASAKVKKEDLEMPKRGHTEEQIVAALTAQEGGKTTKEICRHMGISTATFYSWKKQYAGVGVSELRELRQLREENNKLKRLVADLALDKHILQEVVAKKL